MRMINEIKIDNEINKKTSETLDNFIYTQKSRLIIPLTALTMLAASAFGQSITGRVISAYDRSPVPNKPVAVQTAQGRYSAQTDNQGNYSITITDVKENLENIVSELMAVSYPSPSCSPIVHYALPEASDVKVNVYDILGRKIKEIDAGNVDRGAHYVAWDGKNSNGINVAEGVYFIEVNNGKERKILKQLLFHDAAKGAPYANIAEHFAKAATEKQGAGMNKPRAGNIPFFKPENLDAIFFFTDTTQQFHDYIDSALTLRTDTTNTYDLEAYPRIMLDYPFNLGQVNINTVLDFHKAMLAVVEAPERKNDIPKYPVQVFLDTSATLFPQTWKPWLRNAIRMWNDSTQNNMFNETAQPYTGDDFTSVRNVYVDNDTTYPIMDADGYTYITEQFLGTGRPKTVIIYLNLTNGIHPGIAVQRLFGHELQRVMYAGGICSPRIEHLAYCSRNGAWFSQDEKKMGMCSFNVNPTRRMENYKPRIWPQARSRVY